MAKKADNHTILALILSGYTQVDISKKLGVTKATICKRVKTPEFQSMLAEYRRKIIDGQLAYISANIRKATETLVDLLDDENSFVRLHAASKLINMAQDIRLETDVLPDMEWLEESEQD